MRSRVVLAMVVLLLAVPAAQAHATASRTEPAHLGGLPEAPSEIRIRFTEALAPGQVWVGIFDDLLLRRDLGNDNLSLDPANARILIVPTGHLTKGLYTISYEAVSAVDGHREAGSLPMSIGVPCPACLERAGTDWDSWEVRDSAVRLATYAAVAALLGEATLRWLLRRRGDGPWPQAVVGLGVAAQGLAAAWAFDPRPAVGAAVALLAGAWLLRRPRAWPVAAAGAVALAFVVQAGHSAGAGVWLGLAHALPLLAWVGSLPGLAAWLRTQGDEAGLRRYSRAASLTIAVLAVTALLLSLRRLQGGLDPTHPYVQAWAAKAAIVLLLLGVAALNHRTLWQGTKARPAVDLPGLGRRVRREGLLGALVVVATAVLVALPPPVDVDEGHYRAERWHGDVRVQLTISPVSPDGQLAPGDHLHTVRLWDLEGRPITDASVRLRFRHALLDVGSLEAVLERHGARYSDAGTYLGALGPWEVDVLMRFPDLAATAPDQRVVFPVQLGDVAHLHGGVSIRDPHFDTGYLNPGGSYSIVFGPERAGSYQVHCHPHQWMQMRLTVSDNATVEGQVTVRILGNGSDTASAMRFEPAELAIRPGTQVRFVNEGDLPHTATNVRWTPP